MNKTKLKIEGKKWVTDEIISEEQLSKILARYSNRDGYLLIVLFAILLTGLAIITFIFSDWAQVPHFSRTLLMIIFMAVLYILGDYLFRKQLILYGISFLILGYIVFGTGMLLTIKIYAIQLYSAWPFIIWSIIGLLLYVIYEHKMLFLIGIIVTTVGQMYSGGAFSSFNWLIFLIFALGFAHYVYHRPNRLFGYAFGISFSLQMLILTISESQQYYWLIVYFFVLYLIADLFLQSHIKTALQHVSLLSIFLFGMYQTFLLQEEFFINQIEHQFVFIIIWLFLMTVGIWNKHQKNMVFEVADLTLYLPVFILPLSYVFSLIILFLFSITQLIIGYRQENNEKILLGTIAFLLSTFTTYIQFAWDAMNKSLFFLIGGILLFIISFFLENQRRTLVNSHKGGDR